MNFQHLSDEDLAAQLAASSTQLTYERALQGIKSTSPNLGRDWAVYRLESRADQHQSKERLGQHIQELARSLS